jgi:hypothetical protein
MQDPLIIRCQCGEQCKAWIRLQDNDTDVLGDRHLALVCPQHAQAEDILWDVRPGYLILYRAAGWLPAVRRASRRVHLLRERTRWDRRGTRGRTPSRTLPTSR